MSQVARELGISPHLLSRWCREAKAEGGQAFPGPGRPKDEELAQVKRELARVKKERTSSTTWNLSASDTTSS